MVTRLLQERDGVIPGDPAGQLVVERDRAARSVGSGDGGERALADLPSALNDDHRCVRQSLPNQWTEKPGERVGVHDLSVT